MKNILLVYLPFCTPATPPYSLTNLYSFLKANSDDNIQVLDLNLEFHKNKFSEFQKYYHDMNWDNYDKKTLEYLKVTGKTYSENNKKVVAGLKPELLDEYLKKINSFNPDVVAFSIVYSSQVFYAYSLIKELKVKTVVGGPAVNDKLKDISTFLKNEIELLEFVGGKVKNYDVVLDYSIYNLKDYFTPKPVIPIKTASSCYYKQCTFCTHFNDVNYCEFNLENIKKSIIKSKQKYFFLIDDMISKKRLLEFAKLVKPLNIYWTCQLKPLKEFDLNTLKILYDSGLIMIMWGVESGSDRILKLIKKGTNVKDIKQVLKDSYNVGIKNIAYTIIGFPTETKEEFLETIDLLEQSNVDLVSFSVFGLHEGTEIFNNPKKFSIIKILKEKRTILGDKITYEVSEGLNCKQASKLKNNYQKTIEKINKFPKTMNFFREHMFVLIK